MEYFSKPRFTSLENRTKGCNSVWTINQDSSPLKTILFNQDLMVTEKMGNNLDVRDRVEISESLLTRGISPEKDVEEEKGSN